MAARSDGELNHLDSYDLSQSGVHSGWLWPRTPRAEFQSEYGDSQCELADLTRGERVVRNQCGTPRPSCTLSGKPLQLGRKAGVVLQSVSFGQYVHGR